MADARYRQLKKLMHLMLKQGAMPLPPIRALVECLDLAVTDEEVELLLRLGTDHVTRQRAAALSGLPADRFDALFDTLLHKGMLNIDHVEGGEDTYWVAAIFVGWGERQLCRGGDTEYQREFIRRVDRLFAAFRRMNILPLRVLQNLFMRYKTRPFQSVALVTPPPGAKKTVQIHRSIEAQPSEIHPTAGVLELVERHAESGFIAVVHCFCRIWRRNMGEPCRFKLPEEACIVLGDEARHAIQYGFGRAISKQDALELISKVQKKGAIHTVFHQRDEIHRPEIAICNCCWDCCGLWGSYNRSLTALHLKCHFQAVATNHAACNGCGRCELHCPTGAIVVKDGKSVLDADRCVGCGQCAYQCERNVHAMVPVVREVILPLRPLSAARIRS
jgi:ferredoxin